MDCSDVFLNLQQLQHIDFYNNPKLLALSYHHSPLSAALWYQPLFSIMDIFLCRKLLN